MTRRHLRRKPLPREASAAILRMMELVLHRRRHPAFISGPASVLAVVLLVGAAMAPAQTSRPATDRAGQEALSRARVLRGEYGRYRANNDLLFYHLDVRVDPDEKFISGKNTIRFRMLEDDDRIQIDLARPLAVDKIVMGDTELEYEREEGAVFIDFPQPLKAGSEHTIDFHYSGKPAQSRRESGIIFGKDPAGRHWITTTCELP